MRLVAGTGTDMGARAKQCTDCVLALPMALMHVDRRGHAVAQFW